MAENEILAEIHRTREAIAREHDCDVAKLVAHFREVAAKLESEGWRVSAPEPVIPRRTAESAETSIVREEPPEQ